MLGLIKGNYAERVLCRRNDPTLAIGCGFEDHFDG
jgi:hypothetical protein